MSRKRIEIAPLNDGDNNSREDVNASRIKHDGIITEAELQANHELQTILDERDDARKQLLSAQQQMRELADLITASTIDMKQLVSILVSKSDELAKGYDFTLTDEARQRLANDGKILGDNVAKRIHAGTRDLVEAMTKHINGHYVSNRVLWASIGINAMLLMFYVGMVFLNAHVFLNAQLWRLIALTGVSVLGLVAWPIYTHVQEWRDGRECAWY